MLWLDRQLATTDILKFKVESDQRNANLYISRIEKNESIVRSKFDDELVLQVWSYEMMLLSFIDFDFFLFFFFSAIARNVISLLCEKKKWCFFLFWNFLTELIEPCDPS
jgi:hypothetical protein